MQTPVSDASAWYRHPWVWFIVGLLGISVIGSLYTVSIAYSLGDIEVSAESARSLDDVRSEVGGPSRSQER